MFSFANRKQVNIMSLFSRSEKKAFSVFARVPWGEHRKSSLPGLVMKYTISIPWINQRKSRNILHIRLNPHRENSKPEWNSSFFNLRVHKRIIRLCERPLILRRINFFHEKAIFPVTDRWVRAENDPEVGQFTPSRTVTKSSHPFSLRSGLSGVISCEKKLMMAMCRRVYGLRLF